MTLEIAAPDDLHTTLAGWRRAGARIALVPTMGALHAGHLALVAKARTLADRVVVSIFVNPTQFGPTEDFSQYPRPLEADLAQLRAAGADAAWLPAVATMYPDGPAITHRIDAPFTRVMDGAARPGHFDGVATIVAALFAQVQPDLAVFGEKDYQQLLLIKRLVSELALPIKVVAMPTQREVSGLARSSRNRYLTDEQLRVAPMLYAALQAVAGRIRQGEPVADSIAAEKTRLAAHGFVLDYLDYRNGANLEPLTACRPGGRLFVAAKLGTTRLIDNTEV